MDNPLRLLGRRIKEERKKKGMTQEKLAELSGISNNFISYIESGNKNASLKTIKKIADALEITLSDLFREISVSKKPKTDPTIKQLVYLIQNKNTNTKKFILNVCRTIIREKNRKYG